MKGTSASELKRSAIVRVLCLSVFLVLAGSFSAFGQATTPEQTVKAFYKWYVHSLNASDKGPSKAQLRPHISARLARWMNTKEYAEWDADYFLSAQDFGSHWGDYVQVSKVALKDNVATLHVKLVEPPTKDGTGMGDRELDLKLVKEAGAWKIDRVNAKD